MTRFFFKSLPHTCMMYGILTYIRLKFMVNVGKYTEYDCKMAIFQHELGYVRILNPISPMGMFFTFTCIGSLFVIHVYVYVNIRFTCAYTFVMGGLYLPYI